MTAPVIRQRISGSAISKLLVGKGIQKRTKLEPGRTGARSPRCSGFLISDDVYTARVRYVCEHGTADDERRYHQQIVDVLWVAGYTASIYDGPISGHVGVHVIKLRAPTAKDWDALLRISDGAVTVTRDSVKGITRQLFSDLWASELISPGKRDQRTYVSTAELTDAGVALMHARIPDARSRPTDRRRDEGGYIATVGDSFLVTRI
ncbi:hypothetical protein PV392_26330 [Streptomyces sp. ME03-5709C]|nr:hypothetical protein [Streptomyces sp. ME03-5709C]